MKIQRDDMAVHINGRLLVVQTDTHVYTHELTSHEVGELFMEMFRVAPKEDAETCCGQGCCGSV